MREGLPNQASFHQEVAGRFRLVPNFLCRPRTRLKLLKDYGVSLLRHTSTIPSQHSLKSVFLFSFRVFVQSATALYATADFLWAMALQRATLRRKYKLSIR